MRGTGSYIWYSPGWDISLRLALEVFFDMICFRGEGTVHSEGAFPHQLIPLSLGSHTHSLLNITISHLVGSVSFYTCLLSTFTFFHFSLLYLMNANLAPVISWALSICHTCIMEPLFRYVREIFHCWWKSDGKGINNCCQNDIFWSIFSSQHIPNCSMI